MRLFLDQMIDRLVAEALREKGHDVVCASDAGMARSDDLLILEYRIDECRILVTLDEHFGDWAVIKLGIHPGVIRIKADPTTTKNIQSVLFPFLEKNASRTLSNTLAIVKSTGTRFVHTA